MACAGDTAQGTCRHVCTHTAHTSVMRTGQSNQWLGTLNSEHRENQTPRLRAQEGVEGLLTATTRATGDRREREEVLPFQEGTPCGSVLLRDTSLDPLHLAGDSGRKSHTAEDAAQ